MRPRAPCCEPTAAQPATGSVGAGDCRRCPGCGGEGSLLPRSTPSALALDPTSLPEERYRFCGNLDCHVVWFGEATRHPVTSDGIRVRVGAKETSPDRPVCYCFGHSAADVHAGVGRGAPLSASIAARCERGEERCADTNPCGRCCLGVVRRIERDR